MVRTLNESPPYGLRTELVKGVREESSLVRKGKKCLYGLRSLPFVLPSTSVP